jgi:hypothetical protein
MRYQSDLTDSQWEFQRRYHKSGQFLLNGGLSKGLLPGLTIGYSLKIVKYSHAALEETAA